MNFLYSTTAGLIIQIVWFLGLFVVAVALNPSKKSPLNIMFKIACVGVAFIPMIIADAVAPGVSDTFQSIHLTQSTVILTEDHYSGRSGELSINFAGTRLHALDKKTGQKLYGTLAAYNGGVSFLGSKDDTVLLRINTKFRIINDRNFSTVKEFSLDTLQKEFGEFKDGINEIQPGSNPSANPVYLRIQANNAKIYSYFPFENKLTEGETTNPENSASSDSSNQPVDEKKYIEGKVADYDPQKKESTILYYSSLKKDNSILVHLDANGNEIWTFDQSKQNLKDDYYRQSDKPPGIDLFVAEGNFYYFNIGGYVVCLEKTTGKIVWSTRI